MVAETGLDASLRCTEKSRIHRRKDVVRIARGTEVDVAKTPHRKRRRPRGHGRSVEAIEHEPPDIAYERPEVRFSWRPRVGLIDKQDDPSLSGESGSHPSKLGLPGRSGISDDVERLLVELEALGEVDERRMAGVVG